MQQSANKKRSTNTQVKTPVSFDKTPQLTKTLISGFFLAHAVRARGSNGHQNVLWSVNYSQVVREQVKCKKPDVFRMQKQNKPPKHKHKPNTTRRKTSSKLSETLRFQKDEILGALSTSSRRHSDSRK